MKSLICALTILVCLNTAGQAADWKKLAWGGSMVYLSYGSAADAASSMGGQEANHFLAGPDGRFGGRGVGLKIGIAGGVAGLEYLTSRWIRPKHGNGPAYLAFAASNVAMGEYYRRVAANNNRLMNLR